MIELSLGSWKALFGDVFPTTEEAYTKEGKFAFGFFLIFLQCIILVANAMMTQYIFEENELESPFIMTYIGIASLTIAFPIHVWLEKQRIALAAKKEQHEASLEAESFDSYAEDLQRYQCYGDLVDIAARRTLGLVNDHESTWNHRKHIMAALLITPAMFLGDWAFNASLLSTSVASSTVLASVQSIFVYVLAVVLSLEFYSNWKLVGILAGIAGTALTAMHDGNNDDLAMASQSVYSDVITYSYNATASPEEFEFPTSNTWGDTLAILAAVCFATYTIQVRLFCPENEELYSVNLLLGYIGLVSTVPLAPVAIWLFLSEQIRISFWCFFLVVVKGIFDFLVTDYLLFRSIILTGPTVTTVGLGMSIPLAFLADLATGREGVFSLYSTVGAGACTLGFLIVNLAPSTEGAEKPKKEEPPSGDSDSKKTPIFEGDHVVL